MVCVVLEVVLCDLCHHPRLPDPEGRFKKVALVGRRQLVHDFLLVFEEVVAVEAVAHVRVAVPLLRLAIRTDVLERRDHVCVFVVWACVPRVVGTEICSPLSFS